MFSFKKQITLPKLKFDHLPFALLEKVGKVMKSIMGARLGEQQYLGAQKIQNPCEDGDGGGKELGWKVKTR
jgi:hypothetical protein